MFFLGNGYEQDDERVGTSDGYAEAQMVEGAAPLPPSSGHPDHPAGQNFSLDEVRNRLHGQLDIQPISQPSQSSAGGHNGQLDRGSVGGHGGPPHRSGSHDQGWPPYEPTPPPQVQFDARNDIYREKCFKASSAHREITIE